MCHLSFTLRELRLPCKGTGILPPLELTENAITFAATVVGTTAVASLQVNNPRLSALDSAVIRGVAMLSGPRMFEFCTPKDVPVSVIPHTGLIHPGQVRSVCRSHAIACILHLLRANTLYTHCK